VAATAQHSLLLTKWNTNQISPGLCGLKLTSPEARSEITDLPEATLVLIKRR